MGDTIINHVHVPHDLLEPQTFRQCCKQQAVAVSGASNFGFFSYSFHSPILLLKAAFVMRMDSSQQLQNFPQ